MSKTPEDWRDILQRLPPTPEAQAEPPALKRYDLMTNYRCGSSIEEMEPSDDGEWVRYEQIAERITALAQRLDEQLQRGNQWYDAAMQAEARAKGLTEALTAIINTWHTDEIYRIASEAIAQATGEAKA